MRLILTLNLVFALCSSPALGKPTGDDLREYFRKHLQERFEQLREENRRWRQQPKSLKQQMQLINNQCEHRSCEWA